MQFQDFLIERFKSKLKQENTTIHLITHNKTTPVFFVLTAEDPHRNTVEISALNINKQFAHETPAPSQIKILLKEYEKQGWTIHIDAPMRNARAYINIYGFVGTGILQEIRKTYGVTLMLLERGPQIHPLQTRTKQKRHIYMAESLAPGEVDPKAEAIEVRHFSDPNALPEDLLAKGYLITQTFKNTITTTTPNGLEKKEETYYYVLEHPHFTPKP